MPRRTKGRKSSKGGKMMGGSGTKTGYEQVIRVSGAVVLTASNTGGTYWGFTPFGAGGANWFTPSQNGTNYASLSQWGDFRCKGVRLSFNSQTPTSATTSVSQIVASLDSTCTDATVGGSATAAFLTIASRQTARRRIVSNGQFREVKMTFKPVELQNRLWSPQSALTESALSSASQPGNWGVLLAIAAPAANTVYVDVDWFFEVREPTLSGVLLGKETPEVEKRLKRLVEYASFPVSTESKTVLSEQMHAPVAGVPEMATSGELLSNLVPTQPIPVDQSLYEIVRAVKLVLESMK